jgi:cytochrome c oxidase subunit 2
MSARRLPLVLLTNALAIYAQDRSALDPAGPQAGRIDHLWWFLFAISVTVWIIVALALLRALFHGRPDGDAAAREHTAARTVGGAVGVTALILLAILIVSAITGRSLASSPSPHNELNVNIMGHQWWWEFQYVDGPPVQHVTTANEMHIPVGRPVRIHISSDDVIHSFFVPNLYGKLDLIPMHWNTTWFQADRPGIYRGQCAEYCGLQHAKMGFLVIAEPADKFEAWMNAQRQDSGTPSTPEQSLGREVFLAAPCVTCHTIRGTDARATVGPDLTHLASRHTIAAASLDNTRGNLGGWIVDAQRTKPGVNMPGIHLTSDQLEPLITYLESLK